MDPITVTVSNTAPVISSVSLNTKSTNSITVNAQATDADAVRTYFPGNTKHCSGGKGEITTISPCEHGMSSSHYYCEHGNTSQHD